MMLSPLRFFAAIFVFVIAQPSRAFAGAAETAAMLSAEEQTYKAQSNRLREEATAIGRMALKMPALQACVAELTREMQGTLPTYDSCLTGSCSEHWRRKAHWAVARLMSAVQNCQSNQHSAHAMLRSKRMGPPYLEETHHTYEQLVLGHYALGQAQDAITEVLAGYLATLLQAEALHRGSTPDKRTSEDHIAEAQATAQKLLHTWHAPRSARLMLLSARATQVEVPDQRAFYALADAIGHACDTAMAIHDAHRMSMVCALARQEGASEDCIDEANALCDEDNDTWADERQAVRLFERCGVEVQR